MRVSEVAGATTVPGIALSQLLLAAFCAPEPICSCMSLRVQQAVTHA